MADQTVVLADLAGSASSASRFSHITSLLETIGASHQEALFTDTWGDAFIAVFDSAADAVNYSLNLRDRLRYFDWRAVGLRRPPLLRLAVGTGETKWKHDEFQHRTVPEGEVLIEISRIEPVAFPGDIWVTDTVYDILKHQHDQFFFRDLGEHQLPKNYGIRRLYCVYRSAERPAIHQGRHGPLLDEQHYRREDALLRFAFLWLLLDQLPRGSWGRSITNWMKEVWRGIPALVPNPIMEDEGGFETTILNAELLCSILGRDRMLAGVGRTVLGYLNDRYVQGGGFGTLSYSRQGYSVEPHPRHTALALWLLGSVLTDTVVGTPVLSEMFMDGVHCLLSDEGTTLRSFQNDRNPLLLYLVTWQVVRQLQTGKLAALLGSDQCAQILRSWDHSSPRLMARALDISYEGLPRNLKSDRSTILPMTIPYGRYVRMESYSLLSAAMFVDNRMPIEVKHRIRDAINKVVDGYLREFGSPERRHTTDPLRPRTRGIRPYVTDLNVLPCPDLGSTAMLFRVLRTPHIVSALWESQPPFQSEMVRYFLGEDLTELFDRYLANPELYSLTHAGTLAAVLAGTDRRLLEGMTACCSRFADGQVPIDLTDDDLNEVTSERKIEEIVEIIVAQGGDGIRTQLATHSLARLLLDRLRPGRYVRESLTPRGVESVASATLKVYRDRAFAERYDRVWGKAADQSIIAPFAASLKQGSSVLDVGSGPGQYAAEFIRKKYRVTLIDGSEAFLQIARERVSRTGQAEIDCIQCNVIELEERAAVAGRHPFDAIWCSGLFAHIPRDGQMGLLDWFSRLLSPGGLLFVNIMIDNPRLFARDGRYYTYFASANEFEALLAESGFTVEQTLIKTVRGNTYGEPLLETVWANFYARRSIAADAEDVGSMARKLTSLAYQRSVLDFEEIHQGVQREGKKDEINEGRGESRLRKIERELDKMHDLLGECAPASVLDVGCGPGDYSIQMARRGWEVVGVDISDAMIGSARRGCPPELVERVAFLVGDMMELPDEWRNRFDAILCVTAFQHIPVMNGHALRVLKGFRKVLKRNGLLRIDVQLGRETGFDPDLRFIQGYPTADDAKALFAEAEFRDLLYVNEWTLPAGQNSFRRPMKFRFADFWLRKTRRH